MIDPVNPDVDALFIWDNFQLIEDLPPESIELIETSVDNHLIELRWRNLTITMRAASWRAILEMEGA